MVPGDLVAGVGVLAAGVFEVDGAVVVGAEVDGEEGADLGGRMGEGDRAVAAVAEAIQEYGEGVSGDAHQSTSVKSMRSSVGLGMLG